VPAKKVGVKFPKNLAIDCRELNMDDGVIRHIFTSLTLANE